MNPNEVTNLENSTYSSKKTVQRYKGVLIVISILAIGLMSAFGIRAYQVSKIDPFEKAGSTLASDYFLSSAKDYFDQDVSKLPVASGTCSNVDLRTVQEANMMSDIAYYNRCNKSSTYVRACKLESGTYHFEVNMECGQEELAYSEEKDLDDETVLSKKVNAKVYFQYQALKLDSDDVTFGEIVSKWKDEIDETYYKVLKETTYYRTRDKVWRFKGDVRYFYPQDKSMAVDVEEHYIVSPDNEYNFKLTSQNYAYKWYLQLDGSDVKHYYPSGSTDITKENTYYITAPVKGAKKEESTKAFAAKYYKIVQTDFSEYYPDYPSNNATKLKDSLTWSEWTEYMFTIPKFDPYGKGNRQVETRVKVEYVPIYTEKDKLEWQNVTNEFITEKELINKLKQLGYDVSNINDILGLKDVKYEIKQTYKEVL